jgi:hypothetical protein
VGAVASRVTAPTHVLTAEIWVLRPNVRNSKNLRVNLYRFKTYWTCLSLENEMKVPITTNRPNISEHGSCGNPLSHQQIVMGGVSEPPHFDSRWHVTLFMRKKPTQTSLVRIKQN